MKNKATPPNNVVISQKNCTKFGRHHLRATELNENLDFFEAPNQRNTTLATEIKSDSHPSFEANKAVGQLIDASAVDGGNVNLDGDSLLPQPSPEETNVITNIPSLQQAAQGNQLKNKTAVTADAEAADAEAAETFTLARIRETDGNVKLKRNGQELIAKPGDEILAGDLIDNTYGAAIKLDFIKNNSTGAVEKLATGIIGVNARIFFQVEVYTQDNTQKQSIKLDLSAGAIAIESLTSNSNDIIFNTPAGLVNSRGLSVGLNVNSLTGETTVMAIGAPASADAKTDGIEVNGNGAKYLITNASSGIVLPASTGATQSAFVPSSAQVSAITNLVAPEISRSANFTQPIPQATTLNPVALGPAANSILSNTSTTDSASGVSVPAYNSTINSDPISFVSSEATFSSIAPFSGFSPLSSAPTLTVLAATSAPNELASRSPYNAVSTTENLPANQTQNASSAILSGIINNNSSNPVSISSINNGGTVKTTGTGDTNVINPLGNLTISNEGSGIVSVSGMADESALTATGSGTILVINPIGSLSINNIGIGIINIIGVSAGRSIATNGSGETVISSPIGNLTVVNNGTGTTTVSSVPDGSTVEIDGSGPTVISAPEGDLLLTNTSTGTTTVSGVAAGSIVEIGGTDSTLISAPEGDLALANTGTGTTTVSGLSDGSSVAIGGSGPTVISAPEGDLALANTGTGTTTVSGVAAGSTVEIGGTGPTVISAPEGDVVLANTGTGTTTVSGVAAGSTVAVSGSGPTVISAPEGDLVLTNTGTGTTTVSGVAAGSTVEIGGTGPTVVSAPEGDVVLANTGTGTTTVSGVPDGSSVAISGTGPTVINTRSASR